MIYVLNKKTPGRENWLQRLFSPHPVNTTLSFSLMMIVRDSVDARHNETQVKAIVQLCFPEPVQSPTGSSPQLRGVRASVWAFSWLEVGSPHSRATSQLLCVNPPVMRPTRLSAGQGVGPRASFQSFTGSFLWNHSPHVFYFRSQII